MKSNNSIITSKELSKMAMAIEKLRFDGLIRSEDWDYEEHKGVIHWYFRTADAAYHYGQIFMNAIGFESVQILRG